MKLVFLALVGLNLIPSAHASTDGTCSSWATPARTATVDDDKVNQVSGIVASHRYPGLIWAEEDAGSDPELIAIDADGTVLNRVNVTGAENTDWEDITLGPCADTVEDACGCLYLGDLGSNDQTRTEGVVWVVPEPSPLDEDTRPATALRFRWPDGPHDAEALLVHPQTGAITLITKEATGPARIYRFPGTALQPSAETVELLDVGVLDLAAAGSTGGRVTGGAISPLGDRVVVRTTADALLFALGAADVGAALQREAERVPVHESDAGEAITFSPDGERLLLIDEGASPDLWEVACVAFEPRQTDDADPLGTCETAVTGCACTSGALPRSAPWLATLLLAVHVRRRAAPTR